MNKIESKETDLGGLIVRRALPSGRQRMVGPCIFFDHFGPATYPPGEGIAVRPHPHIGLATITYLFEGQVVHRDSLGVEQTIRPGAVNLMVAGRGIVHSERTGDDLETTSQLHGIQTWISLPVDQEETDPEFLHYPSADIPEVALDEASVRVIIGEAYGMRSPVKTFATTLYLDCHLSTGAQLTPPDGCEMLGVYVIDGALTADGETIGAGTMAVFDDEESIDLVAREACHFMMLGGDNLGERYLWWNFVSSSKARITQAGEDWKAGRFDPVPGETEWIPLPE